MEILVVLLRPGTIEYVGTERHIAFTIAAELKNNGEPVEIQKWIHGKLIAIIM